MNRSARPRFGILISMFRELRETLVLRELVALERRGVDSDTFSLRQPRDPITIEEAWRLSTTKPTYSALVDAATLGAFVRAPRRRPRRVLAAMASVVRRGRDRPKDVLKNLAVLPIALHVGALGRSRGITRRHGHRADVPTAVCGYLGEIEGQAWSAAIHGEDVFSPNRVLARELDAARLSVVCRGHFCRHLREELGLEAPERVHPSYHGLDPRLLERADVLGLAPRLLPGHPPDGVPDVIAEAMALGVPVATTRVSAMPERVAELFDQERRIEELVALLEARAAVETDGADSSRRAPGAGESR